MLGFLTRGPALLVGAAVLGLAASPSGAAPAPLASAGPAPGSVVRVKLPDDGGIALSGGRLRLVRGGTPLALDRLTATLAAHGLRRLQPVFGLTPAEAARTRATLSARTGRPLPDLSRWLRVTVADGRAAAAARELSRLPSVQAAFPEPEPAPAPASPDYRPRQVYPAAAPLGIGSSALAGITGAKGAGVTVADVEYTWNTRHEDLAKLRAPGAVILNGTPNDPFGSDDHGTAVAGMIGATADGVGVTGLVPEAALKVVNADTTDGYNPANAVDLARRHLRAGDVILLEQQLSGPEGTNRWVPAEYALDVFDAVRTATAAGVIVVAAAGNGNVDLDDPRYAEAFGPNGRSSGAILVGAGSAGLATVPGCVEYSGWPARSRLPYSNYGSRVDVQGWGGCVFTTGYGDVNTAAGRNGWYTARFSGTSSASPMVAAAAAALSGAYRARYGRPPTPGQVRSWLSQTGTAQQSSPFTLGGRIGGQPDLRRAFAAAGLAVPAVSAPGAPTRPAATLDATTGRATLTWQAPASMGGTPIAGYLVTRDGRDAAGGALFGNSVSAASRSVVFEHLAPGTTYQLGVRAVNSSGPGAAATVTVAPAAAVPRRPAEVKASTTGTTATISWKPPADGPAATGYLITRDGRDSAGGGPVSVAVGAGTRTKTFGKLVRGRTYTLTVQAVNAAGDGPGVAKSVTIKK